MKCTFTALLLFFLPQLTSAHTRWFADEALLPYVTSDPTSLYLSIFTLIILTVVLVGVWFEQMDWCNFRSLNPSRPHVFERAASTFVMAAGAFFIIAGTHEYLFSPNLSIEVGIPMFLVVLQIIIGLAFLLGIASRVAGIALGFLWATLFYYTGWVSALEDIWVLSTAVFVTLMGNDYFSIVTFSFIRNIVAPYKKFALSFLRIGTGITLMVLGLSEKILAPEFGIHFLEQYDWNFMEALGFVYSDYLFTLSAGSVEFLFGLIFVLGIVTRMNALVVAIVFTIPLFILGPMELAGHLPHFAAIIMLLLFGSGGHFTFFGNKSCRHTGISYI